MKSNLTLLFLAVCAVCASAFARSTDHAPADLTQAGSWIAQDWNVTERYEYLMNAHVRLLFFWVGADDVGGGYIQRAVSSTQPNTEAIELLFGSDPQKAPRHINHWGAAMEISRRAEHGLPFSVLFGFMKSAHGKSAKDAEAEIASQKSGNTHNFEGVISLNTPRGMASRVIPVHADRDFTFRELDSARSMVLEKMAGTSVTRSLSREKASCDDVDGFLYAVDSIAKRALRLPRSKIVQCYVYNARPYTLTVVRTSAVPAKTVKIKLRGSNGRELETKYTDLVLADFETFNHESHERTTFQVLFGTSGDLRGVPVQIVHQPNWWFRVELNLFNPRRLS